MTESVESVDRRQRLWHRLVGAAVLAALAVILVPTLLDLRDEDSVAIKRSNIPERPPGFRVEEIALIPEIVTPPPAAAVSESRPESRSEPHAEDPAVPATADAPRPAAPAPAAAAPLRGFAVQLGSFSSEENAVALRDRLRGKGYSAFTDRATVDGRAVFRVLVGPDARREHSERLRDRLAGEMDQKGVVVAYE